MVFLEPVLLAVSGRMRSPADAVSLTTTELGRMLGTSQQTACRYLKGLEERGWVQRVRDGRCFSLRLTAEGIEVLRDMHAGLGRFLQPQLKPSFEGVIASGIGEGAYYVKEYSGRIHKALGYMPYPGTLNVRFKGDKPQMSTDKTTDIMGFKSGARSFGRVGLTPVRLHVRSKSMDCHVIIPERTHHRRDIELIAKDNLRKRYGIKDGDKATVTLN
jgi:riboflavin kinase